MILEQELEKYYEIILPNVCGCSENKKSQFEMATFQQVHQKRHFKMESLGTVRETILKRD